MRFALLTAVAALACGAAFAEPIHEAEMANGAIILLHDTAGPCVGEARYAQFITADCVMVPGCWRDLGGHIAIVFLDGDIGAIPKGALKPARTT